MKRIYKIALAASLLLCTGIVCHHLITSAPPSDGAASGSNVSPGVDHPRSAVTVTASLPRNPAPPPPAVRKADPAPAETAGADRASVERPRHPWRVQRVVPPPPLTSPEQRPMTPQGDVAALPIEKTAPVRTTPARTSPDPETPPTYVVREGDTFSSIAVAAYGSERRWRDIQAANPTITPRRLRPGQILKLPRMATGPERTTPRARSKEATVHYVVRAGDTLTTIASQHYRQADAWRKIYEANRDRIGPNPDRLLAGISLRLDPRFTAWR